VLRCELFGDDRHERRDVLVRARYSDLKRDPMRWEQAFSEDGGEALKTNWIMAFARKQPSSKGSRR
jgi:hypothetical protein